MSTYPVWRRNGGGPVRAWHLLNGLARRGWAVEVVSITPDRVPVTRHLIADHPEAPGSTVPGPGGVVETVVPLSPRHLDAEARLRLVTGPMAITDIAAGLMWRATPTLEREARNALAASDAVVLVQPYFADLAGLGDGHPVVLDAHNHETSMKAELLPANPGGHWLSDRVAELECRALHEAAVVTATTAEDLERLDSQAQGLHVPTGVIPNGADVGNIEFVTGPARRQCRRALLAQLGPGRSLERVAVFVGSGHGPNIEAGRRLVRMAAQLPDVLFVLAGRHSELLGLRHIPDNVRLEGVVDEQTLKRLMEGADVALNPMAHGGGSNIKLVEYFAAGVPVVSTPLGTRGLVGAEQLAVVSDLDGFGDAIAGLLSDPQHCDALAEAARAHAAAHLDWTVLADRFAALVTTTLR